MGRVRWDGKRKQYRDAGWRRLVLEKRSRAGRVWDAHRMRLRLIGTGRGCAVAGDESLLRLFIPRSCYNAAVVRRVFTIAFKILHRAWIILTSDTITYREYAAIVLILGFIGFTAWDLIDGNNLKLFRCCLFFRCSFRRRDSCIPHSSIGDMPGGF